MDDIRTLLRDAVDDVHADPQLGPSIVRRQRHGRRRLLPLVAVAAAVLLVLGLIGATVALTRPRKATPAAPASTERRTPPSHARR